MRIIHRIRLRLRYRRSRKESVLMAASVLLMISGFTALALIRPDLPAMPAQGAAGPRPETVEAVATTYVPKANYTARVAENPQVPVAPSQPAYVRKIEVIPGNQVSKGQALAMLEPADASRAEALAAYEAAEERLVEARAAQNAVKSDVDTLKEAVDSALADLNAAQNALSSAQKARETASTRLQAAENELEQRNAELRQARELHESGVIPSSELQQAEAAVDRATAARDQARDAVQKAEASSKSASADIEAATQALGSAQSRLAAARKASSSVETELRARQEAFSQARARLNAVRMVPLQSPVEGRVSAVVARPGMLATPATPVVTISPVGVSVVEFPVSDTVAAQLAAGSPAIVTPSGLGRTLQGRVQGVYPTPNGGDKRNRVIIEVNDPRQFLKAGADVEVEVPLPEIGVVTVPATSVMTSGDQSSVRVVEGDGPGQTRPVTVIGYEGGLAIISEGLSAGERVVVSPTPIGESGVPLLP